MASEYQSILKEIISDRIERDNLDLSTLDQKPAKVFRDICDCHTVTRHVILLENPAAKSQ